MALMTVERGRSQDRVWVNIVTAPTGGPLLLTGELAENKSRYVGSRCGGESFIGLEWVSLALLVTQKGS